MLYLQERVWVGLRPGRENGCRLDSEYVDCSGRKILVARCYGHGGAGVTLSMGCAHDIVVNHVLPAMN
jgi:D-amino-acid oxidase